MEKQQLLEKLAQEPLEQAKIVYKAGGAFFDIGGKLYRPVLYNCNFRWNDTPNFREKIENFAQADIKLLAMGIVMDRFWVGPGKYDYDELDRCLASAMCVAPNARFLFGLGFWRGIPWWNELHPQELIQYARIDDEFPQDDNIGNYAAPSYASELWLNETAETVRKLIEHVEHSPYGKHIFAYRIDVGVYCEWHYYGMAGAMPDISAPMVKFFRSYLRETYGGDVAQLRKAWNQPEVTFETATPPPAEQRLRYLDGTLRDPIDNAWDIDFLHCIQRSLLNALVAMDYTAKEACGGRALIGNYCGYFFGMGYTAEGWHLVNDAFIRSPYVDFQVSPCCYSAFFRKIGASMLARSLAGSYRLHNKLCIFEGDGRTCLAAEDGNKHSNTIQESIAMLSRDMAQAISQGSAYWNYDFGRDWYNAPEILQYFHKIAPVFDAVNDFHSSAEIAIVADWESGYYHAVQKAYGGPGAYMAINYLAQELKRAGFQFDAYSFADLDNPVLQNYKLYIFPQLFYMTEEKQARLEALKKSGKAFLFMGLPGWLSPHGQDVESLFKTSGIRGEVLHEQAHVKTTLTNGSSMDFYEFPSEIGWKYGPVLKVTDPQATILGTIELDDGTLVPAYAKKINADGTASYICNPPVMTAQELQNIAKSAGVHCYCDCGKGVIFANNSMIAFHTGIPGKYTLRAKKPMKWRMVYPEKRSYPELTSELTFNASQPDTYIFVLDT